MHKVSSIKRIHTLYSCHERDNYLSKPKAFCVNKFISAVKLGVLTWGSYGDRLAVQGATVLCTKFLSLVKELRTIANAHNEEAGNTDNLVFLLYK